MRAGNFWWVRNLVYASQASEGVQCCGLTRGRSFRLDFDVVQQELCLYSLENLTVL